tara:strand:+ start:209 stop:328 length:120 start_codon:yes stop_codon:yes gene_type:complete
MGVRVPSPAQITPAIGWGLFLYSIIQTKCAVDIKIKLVL